MEILKSTFNGFDIEIEDIPIIKANIIFPLVMSWMTEIAIGNFKFFSDLTQDQLELCQRILCENVYKYREKSVGTDIQRIRVNLSLSDLSEHKKGFTPLLIEFLEYNFGFFSEARRIVEPFIKAQKK